MLFPRNVREYDKVKKRILDKQFHHNPHLSLRRDTTSAMGQNLLEMFLVICLEIVSIGQYAGNQSVDGYSHHLIDDERKEIEGRDKKVRSQRKIINRKNIKFRMSKKKVKVIAYRFVLYRAFIIMYLSVIK